MSQNDELQKQYVSELEMKIQLLESENIILKTKQQADDKNSLYKNFFMQDDNCMLILQPNGRIIHANDYFIIYFASDNNSGVSDKNILDFFSNSQKEVIEQKLHECLLVTNNYKASTEATYCTNAGEWLDFLLKFTYSPDNDVIYCSINNITPYNTLNNQYKEKKKLLEEAQKISQVGFWQYSFENNEVTWSDEIYNIYEFGKDTNISLPDLAQTAVFPEDKKMIEETLGERIFETQREECTYRIHVPDGSIKCLMLKAELERDNKNKPVTIFGTITDISNSYFREKKIRENEQLFRSLFSNLTDIFFILKLESEKEGKVTDYSILDVNPMFEMKFGIEKNEVTGKKLSEFLPEIFQQLQPILNITTLANAAQQDRIYFSNLDSYFDVLIYSPAPNMLATIWRDVTLMVEADRSLRESEEKYRQIFSIGNDGLFMVDFKTGRIIDVNPAACFMFEYNRERMLEMSIYQLSANQENLNELIKSQQATIFSEVGLKNNGNKIPVEMNLSYFNWGGHKVVIASVRDISERISSQEKLIKSEQKFKQLFDYSNDAILILRNYRIIDYNKKATAIFQYNEEDLSNKTFWNLSPLKQPSGDDSRVTSVEFLQNSLLGNQLQYEWIFKKRDNSTFYADVKLSQITYGNESVVQAIIRDVTESRENEKALKESEERWKFALEGSSSGVWDWNLLADQVYFSPVWKNILGYADDEFTNLQTEMLKHIHPDDLSNFEKRMKDFIDGKIPFFMHEFRMQCKNGSYKWILSRGRITSYTPQGKPERFIGTHDDITRFKVIEVGMQTELTRLKEVMEQLRSHYWELDLRTMLFTGHEEAFLIFGEPSKQITLRNMEKTIHPDDRDIFMGQFTSHPKNNLANPRAFRVLVQDEQRYIFSKTIPTYDTKGILMGYKGVFQEITELKKVEFEGERNQLIGNSFIEQVHHGLFLLQNDQIILTNKKALEITGYNEEELTSSEFRLSHLAIPEEREAMHKKIHTWINSKTKVARTEQEINTKHNRKKWLELYVSPTKFNDIPAILISFTDITSKKQAETDLIQREEKYRLISEKANIGIGIFNDEGNLTYSNNAFNRLIGNPTEELSLLNLGLNSSKDNIQLLWQLCREFPQGTSPDTSIPLRIQTGNHPTWVQVQVRSLSETNTLIFVESIDLFKKTENDLIDRLQYLEKLLNLEKDGIAIFNKNLDLIYCNETFFPKTGFTKEAPCSSFNELDFALLYNIPQFLTLFQNGEIPSLQFEHPERKDLILKVDMEPILLSEEVYLTIILRDITNSKTEIKNLKTNLERYEAMFNASPLGIVYLDKQRTILRSNESYAQMLGTTSDEIVSKRLDDFLHIENLSDFLSKYSQLFAGLISNFVAIRKLPRNDGSICWIQSHVFSVKDKYGDILYAVGFTYDISDQLQKEKTNLLNERLNTIKILANSLAHQFNNQLMGIYGSAFLLKSKTKDAETEWYASQIIQSVMKSNQLSQKFFSVASSSSHLHILVDIHQMITRLKNSELFVSEIPFQVSIVHTTNHYRVIGDPNLLTIMLQNIFNNSIEAMPKGGRIDIAISDVYFDANETTTQSTRLKEGKYLRIKISDEGIGIPKQVIANIFDPFYSTKKNPLNPGIGLTVAKKIVEQHNGSIRIFRTSESGTEVNIYLPIPETTAIQSLIVPNEQYVFGSTTNILLIDDEEIVRTITTELLKKLGHNVFSFSNCANALKFYTENYHNINLVFLDMHMPDMDGKQVFERIKTINPNGKVILLTGLINDIRIDDMLNNGLSKFVQKPVSIEKLATSISDTLMER